jgi:predicted DNA-binding protein
VLALKKRGRKYDPKFLTEFHFVLPREILERVRALSVKLNTTMSQIFRRAILDYLSKKEQELVEKQQDGA